MLDCKNIKLFWKIISRIIYYVFDIEIHINEKNLLTGYDIDKRKLYLLNLMINFAEYVIYRNHVKRLKSKKKYMLKDCYTNLNLI